MLTATSLPITCAAAIVSASHWVGLTLPGMIELPGSFSGIVISPRPERGPLASQRTSLAILNNAAASDFSAPCRLTSASAAPIASNLLGALTNGRPVAAAISRGHARAEFRMCVEPGPDRRAALRKLVHVRQRGFDVRTRVAQLRHVAGELLAQRQRRRVLQMSAADLDDIRRTPSPLASSVAASARNAAAAGRASPRRQPRRSSPSGTRRSTTGCG